MNIVLNNFWNLKKEIWFRYFINKWSVFYILKKIGFLYYFDCLFVIDMDDNKIFGVIWNSSLNYNVCLFIVEMISWNIVFVNGIEIKVFGIVNVIRWFFRF